MQEIVINEHQLPQSLVAAIEDGRWKPPADLMILEAVFGDRPVQPNFYGREALEFENSTWADETDPIYLGVPDSVQPPGNLDPANSVLIGDLGPDRPFALEYRGGEPSRVVYLTGNVESRWVQVASSIDDLLHYLGIQQ